MSEYILYLGFSYSLDAERTEDLIEKTLGLRRSGSGMGMGCRDIDFTLDSMEACHQAVHALFEVLPQGTTVWAFRDDGGEESEMVLTQRELHQFKRELDALHLGTHTAKLGRKRTPRSRF